MKQIGLIFLFSLTMLRCDKSTPVTDQTYFLQGTVVDSTSGQPIAGATVGFRNPLAPDSLVFPGDSVNISSGTVLQFTQTSPTGSFRFEFFLGGRDTALFHRMFGYKTGHKLWRCDLDPVPINPLNQSTDDITIPLAPGPPPRYYFGPRFKVGMIWTFDHRQEDNDPANSRYRHLWGPRLWTITSMSVVAGDTSYTVDITGQDSVHKWQNYPGTVPYDSLYTVDVSAQFTILISADTVLFDWPQAYRVYSILDSHRMPRVFSSPPPDSITEGYYPYDYGVYSRSSGPTLYYVRWGGTHSYVQSLTLTSFIDPWCPLTGR